jgi:hypothetical protein
VFYRASFSPFSYLLATEMEVRSTSLPFMVGETSFTREETPTHFSTINKDL